MSFFRNFRTKTRSKSSSRDTTPVNMNSRPGSVLSNVTTHTNGSASARRESIDSRTDSLLNRSDTFILDSDQEAEDKESKQNSSNNSTLEKKSKKSKVLSKFATFTKRKKTPPAPEKINDPLEHHPNDNATNTYYKWRADGPASTHTLDYDTQTDPFQFLYEQHSSLKDMKKGNNNSSSNGSANGSIHSTHSSAQSVGGGNGAHEQHSITHNQPFDSSTFRKGKMPAQLKEQLSQLKTQTKSDLHEAEEYAAAEPESQADKYKTVTLNSFRKSFREKFIQNQNNPAHNPAWFVEVEPPKVESRSRCESKENRPDFLIFDNDNYRPNSRSPVREGKERAARSGSRSPVKRNETFRMERPSNWDKSARKGSPERHKGGVQQTPEVSASIRIEIKNSITPNMPTRVVPVGVAKPMPAQDNYHQRASARSTGGGVTVSGKVPKSVIDREKSPLRNWAKPITVTPVRYPSSAAKTIGGATNGRYQTLVQIRNESNAKSATPTQSATAASNRSRNSTRIQLGGGIIGGSPTLQKRLNTPGTRHSLATPLQMNALRSYELLKNTTPIVGSKSETVQQQQQQTSSLRKLQQPKHTYFGGDTSAQTLANGNPPNKTTISTTTFSLGRSPNQSTTTTHTTTTSTTTSNYPSLASRLQQPQVVRVAGGGGSAFSNYQNRSQQHQQQQRVLVPLQRRSRSPIKMPWR